MRIFLLSEHPESVYQLSKKEKRYLFSVLRMKINDVFTAKDREGNFYKAFLFSEDALTLEPTEEPEATLLDNLSGYEGPRREITAYIAVLKNRKTETAVRMLTEIGVKRIVLMETEFTEGSLSEHNKERLLLIIREAVQQSGADCPELVMPVSFDEALRMKEGKAIMLHQSRRARTLDIRSAAGRESISFFIGPEGGFSDAECERAEAEAVLPVLLPTNILRAETAAVYTASALQIILDF